MMRNFILITAACVAVLGAAATGHAETIRFFEPGEATAEDLMDAMTGPQSNGVGLTRGATRSGVKDADGGLRGLPGASPETTPAQSGGVVGYRIRFDFDSDRISQRDAPFLSELARMLAFPEMRDRILVIEGHTDAVGSDSYNLKLSKRRALSVRDYLTDRYGVDPLTLQIIGRGETAPIDPIDPESDANRRVQFYLR